MNPWDQGERETAKAFDAFTVYRDMGRDRSLTRVADITQVQLRFIQKLSKTQRWVERCLSWDRHLDQIRQHALIDRQLEAAEQADKIAKAFLSKLVQRLQSLDPETIDTRSMPSWLKIATDVRRIALGMATEKREVEVNDVTNTDNRDKLASLLDRIAQRQIPGGVDK